MQGGEGGVEGVWSTGGGGGEWDTKGGWVGEGGTEVGGAATGDVLQGLGGEVREGGWGSRGGEVEMEMEEGMGCGGGGR